MCVFGTPQRDARWKTTLLRWVFSVTYVSPPRPIEVKKLMANLVFFGLSRGSKPSNARESSLEREIRRGKLYHLPPGCIVSCCYGNIRVSESLVQLGHAHKLSQLLEKNLHKDTTGGGENTQYEYNTACVCVYMCVWVCACVCCVSVCVGMCVCECVHVCVV